MFLAHSLSFAHAQLEYWLELEVELQIKHQTVSSCSLRQLVSDVIEARYDLQSNARVLSNILNILQWEITPDGNIVRWVSSLPSTCMFCLPLLVLSNVCV